MTEPSVAALLERAAKKRAAVLQAFGSRRRAPCRPEDVRKVLVINAASRSGSSWLYYLLSRHPDVVSLNGEGSVFERLRGIGAVRSREDSDAVLSRSVDDKTLALVAGDILSEAGALFRGSADFPKDDFLADCVQRLILQYPERDLEPERLHAACSQAFGSHGYWGHLLEMLGLDVWPAFENFVLEEPPFVVPRERLPATPAFLEKKTLLLKSSADVYRMALARRMFPKARFQFVVLARNPAASISALMDGWQSPDFHSHNLEGIARLDIAGYSGDAEPGTRRWWKFDLPPGWDDFASKPLEDVCAFQWLSANARIRADIKDKVVDDFIEVRYESFLKPDSLKIELEKIARFAGLEGPVPEPAPGPVMAVSAPAAGKWRKRKERLRRIVSGGAVLAMARELGYGADWENWP